MKYVVLKADRYENPSLLDTDLYKGTMLRFIRTYYPNAYGWFEFFNRHSDRVKLLDYIDPVELRERFEHLRKMRFTQAEIAWLRNLTGKSGKKYLTEADIQFLENEFRFPEVNVEVFDKQLKIQVMDYWKFCSWAETFILNNVSSFYVRGRLEELDITQAQADAEADRQLDLKIAILREYYSLKFSEFATRRRPWQERQEKTNIRFAEEFGGQPRYLGTSNMDQGRRLHIPVMGTFAHELPMGAAAMHNDTDEALRASQCVMLQQWEDLFAPDLLTGLTDTFGDAAFYEDFKQFAPRWGGVRPDSGDAFEEGERAIRFYQEMGIDPMKGAAVVFSDGLTIQSMIELFKRFQGRIWTVNGWGTSAVWDFGKIDLKPFSAVCKLMGIKDGPTGPWRPTVKLSNNPNKAMGMDKAEIARYRRVFGCDEQERIDVVY